MTLGDRLSRYKDLAWFVAKYSRADFVSHGGADSIGTEHDAPPAEAEAFTRDLEALGPTFIKLGQLLSTRADLLPPAYIDALSRLQDDLDPFPFTDVECTLREELGVRLSKAFVEFDPVPVAAASLGQVHRAVLRADGRWPSRSSVPTSGSASSKTSTRWMTLPLSSTDSWAPRATSTRPACSRNSGAP